MARRSPTMLAVAHELHNPREAALRRQRVWNAPAPLRLWHLCSLDAPTVAAAWAWGFSWAARLPLPHWTAAVLALVVWVIYVGDRLLDARAALRLRQLFPLRERHHFHWRHRHVLIPFAAGAALAAAMLIATDLPARAIEPDSLVAAATMAYFSGVHSRRRAPRFAALGIAKNAVVAALFTAGCLLPVCTQAPLRNGLWFAHSLLFAPIAFFAMLAWLNLFAIGCWESSQTRERSVHIFFVASMISAAGLVSAAALAHAQPRCAALLVCGAISAGLLAALDLLRPRMTGVALRAAADAVLLTPLALMLAAR